MPEALKTYEKMNKLNLNTNQLKKIIKNDSPSKKINKFLNKKANK